MKWNLETPPGYAKDAIATERGWADAKTGEILVSCKRLENAVKWEDVFEPNGKPKKVKAESKAGGARTGAGRPTNEELAKRKAEAEEKAKAEAEKAAKELAEREEKKEAGEPVKVEPKSSRKPRGRRSSKKAQVKKVVKEPKSEDSNDENL